MSMACTFQQWRVFRDSYAVDFNKTVRVEVAVELILLGAPTLRVLVASRAATRPA